MEHAATAFNTETVAPGFSALLRLRQGASSRSSMTLADAPGGTMISIGTDPRCDWQIRAAFVPERAFSLLFVSGAVFLRSGPELGVLLNGRPVEDGWVPVASGDRIDVGLARLEVQLVRDESEPTIIVDASATEEQPRVTRPYVSPVPQAAPEADLRAERLSELDQLQFDESGEYEVAPALLEDDAPTDKRSLKRYALLGVITVTAYSGWVALLDHL